MQKRKSSKRVAVFFCALLVFSLVPLAFAEGELEEEGSQIESIENDLEGINAGTTPGDSLYNFDVAMDNFRYSISLDKENIGLKIAEERLEEIKTLSEEGRLEDAERAREEHEKIVSRVKLRIEERLADSSDEKALARSVRVGKILSLQEAELEDLRDRLSNLTPEQKIAIINFLLGSEDAIGRLRLDLEDSESRALLKYESRLGKTRTELRDEIDRLREEKRLKAEVLDDKSVVTVEYRFKSSTESHGDLTVERLIEKTLNEVKTTLEEARLHTRISDGSGEDNHAGEEIAHEVEKAESAHAVLVTGNVVDDNDCGEPEIPSCEEGTRLEDYKDDLGCKFFKCIPVDKESTAVCENPEIPTCEDGAKLKDYRNDLGCKIYICIGEGAELAIDDGKGAHDFDDDFKDALEKRLRLDITLRQKEDRLEAEVRFRLRFISGTEPEEIYADIVEETNALTFEQLKAIVRVKERDENKEEDSREIQIKIREKDGKAYAEVDIEWDGHRKEMLVDSVDNEVIIKRIAEKLGVSVDEVRVALNKDERDGDNNDDESDSDDDSGKGDDSDSDDDKNNDSDGNDDKGGDDEKNDSDGNGGNHS